MSEAASDFLLLFIVEKDVTGLLHPFYIFLYLYLKLDNWFGIINSVIAEGERYG